MTNLSKQKREVLEGKIELLRGKLDATDVEAQNALFALEAELKHKKYGLVWEEHEEEIDRTLSENLPVLTEQTELAVNAGGLTHFLLEGDNLAALEILKRTHKGKIDVIYIDPPYNTGNKDFMYDDAYIEGTDGFHHSKWLSFMSKRLKFAKYLLDEDGVIFISIDDIEYSQLKLLCDEIFGGQNYVSTLHWKRKKQPSYLHGQVAGVMEYVLIYAKDRNKLCKLSLETPTDTTTRVDNASNQLSEREFSRGVRVKTDPEIDVIKKGVYQSRTMTTEFLNDVYIKNGRTTNAFKAVARFRDSQDRIDLFCRKDVIFITKNLGFRRDKLDEEKNKRKAITDLILDWGDNQDSDQEIKDIFKEKRFDYPKPSSLIKNLVKSYVKKNATVLDFFAGSGTTGQAVLELNEEDGGSRQFILCTNNENDICRNITYERMKTVITGKRQDGSAYSDGIAATLKYDKIDYVAVKEDGDILLYDDYADELLAHVREMVELENGISFETDSTIKICLYEDELDEFVDALDEKSEVRAVYVGHDLLMTAQQKAKLAALNVAVNIIPQYYYEDEV